MRFFGRKNTMIIIASVACLVIVPSASADAIGDRVISQIEKNISTDPNPRLALVGRSYAIHHYRFSQVVPSSALNDRLEYITNHLRFLIDIQKNQKKSREGRQSFLDTNRKSLTGDLLPPSICDNTANISIIDDVARVFDLPAPLLMATHWMETTCRRGLYEGGPYQLSSQSYLTGNLSDQYFFMQTVDVARFMLNKYARYNRSNPDNPIPHQYAGMTIDALITHGSLYNGLSGANLIAPIAPARESYVFANRGTGDVARKNGLLASYLRMMNFLMLRD